MEIPFIHTRHLVYAIVGFILFDLLNLAAFLYPQVNDLLLPLVVALASYLAIRDLKWGLLIPLAELVWGSFGSELTWELAGVTVPLRMVLFATFLTVWFIKTYVLRSSEYMPRAGTWNLSYLLLLGVVIWGMIIGFIRGNDPALLFVDANAYFYLLYYPLWRQVFRLEHLRTLVSIIVGGALALAVKTLLLFHAFVNQYDAVNIPLLYVWIRDTRIGEITPAGGNLWRIFIQSQVYTSIVLMWWLVYIVSRRGRREFRWELLLSGSILIAATVVSLSRSFWLGIIIAVAVSLVVHFQYLKSHFRRLKRSFLYVGGSMAGALVLIAFLVYVPNFGEARLASSLFERVVSTDDPAGTSRLQLLPHLLQGVSRHIIFGNGFGTTITYQSSDPRYKSPINPDGTITTYAFEWGYLDQLLKFGSLGFIIFMSVVIVYIYLGLRIVRRQIPQTIFVASLVAGLMMLAVVHVASPYLNHPLGLGYLMLSMIAVQYFSTHKDEKNNG